MISITPLLLIAVMATDAEWVDPLVESNEIRIETRLTSQIYVWEVTNLDGPALTDFTLTLSGAYNHRAPEGWQWDMDGTLFHAWTEDARLGIKAGKSAEFSVRAASSGPALRTTIATVTRDGNDAPVELTVWAPGVKRRDLAWVISATLIGLGLMHAGVQSIGDRRRAARQARS